MAIHKLHKRTFFILLLLALAAQAQQERVAIINTLDDLDSIGFSDLSYLTNRLRETAVNVLPNQQFGVMTTESIIAFLGSQENARRVCNESSCLAEVGRKVNASYVAQARIGRFGGQLSINFQLYNSKTGNLIDSFTGHSKDVFGLLAVIDEKAPALFKKMLDAQAVVFAAPQQETAPSPLPPPPAPQYTPPVTTQRDKVHKLIKDGFKENKDKIQMESVSLSDADREFLYNKNRKRPFGWVVLNTVPGFGLGSYIQGDIKSGVILSIADVVGWSLTIFGFQPYSPVIIGMGMSVLVISHIMSLSPPYIYAEKYNKLLNEALNINNNISYSIDPLIIPKDGAPAVGLAFNGRF